MTPMPRLFRVFLAFLVSLLLMLAAPLAMAAGPLLLDDSTPHVEAWPAVGVLRDPGGALSA